VDFTIEGPDARAAGVAFGRQSNPLHLYDVPREMEAELASFVRARGLDARLVAQPQRVPHRRRVEHALVAGDGCGVVQFSGIPAIAVRALPRAATFDVLGTRMGAGRYAERWRSIDLEIQPNLVVTSTRTVGDVAVDEARLMFADADALGAWSHEAPLDGMADFAFWGRDAAGIVSKVGAPQLDDGVFGWCDLAIQRAFNLGTAVESMRTEGAKFATDFRPHSHHFAMMKQVRASPTESGVLDLGGARLCAFMTSWGDGFFPVHLDLDAERRPVRLRVDLGTEARIASIDALTGGDG